MELRLQLKMQQKLVMTQQMRQAIKLLQLNNIELEQALESEMLANPSIELEDKESPIGESELEKRLEAAQPQADLVEQQNGSAEDDALWKALLQEDQRSDTRTHNMRGGYIYNDLPPIEANHSASDTLTEELMGQLRLEHCTDGERIAAEFIIGNLDEKGYLDCTYDEVLAHTGVELDDVEGAILMLREFSPIGCGARDLIECLVFQAEVKYPQDPFFSDIIRNHIKDLERKKYKQISSAMEMHIEDVEEYHLMLQEFEPCPGRAFIDLPDYSISPDVKVMKVDDEWQVISSDDGLPKIRLSAIYQKLLRQFGNTQSDNRFIEEKMRSAKFLIESLYKRERTIVQVMECILIRQYQFFEQGHEYLRPMVLRDVAEDIGVHESTVSRVTSGKYVECPQGIFELKYFFSSGIQQFGGVDLAASSVKIKIKRLIENENRKKPLSDNAIVKLLSADGLQIARRTVTKYREAMRIPSSRDRRER